MRPTYRSEETDRAMAGSDVKLGEPESHDEKRRLMARIRAARWTRPSRRRRGGLSEVHRVRLTAHEGPAW